MMLGGVGSVSLGESRLRAWGQDATAALYQQLDAAVATQNWPLAIATVDSLLLAAPERADELNDYRRQLQQRLASTPPTATAAPVAPPPTLQPITIGSVVTSVGSTVTRNVAISSTTTRDFFDSPSTRLGDASSGRRIQTPGDRTRTRTRQVARSFPSSYLVQVRLNNPNRAEDSPTDLSVRVALRGGGNASQSQTIQFPIQNPLNFTFSTAEVNAPNQAVVELWQGGTRLETQRTNLNLPSAF